MRLSTQSAAASGESRGRELTAPAARFGVADQPAGVANWAPLTGQVDPEFMAHLRDLLTEMARGQATRRVPHRIVVTGVHAETGASFLAAALAMTCAEAGYRVLLVDVNYDDPSVHRQLGLPNQSGLSTLLTSSDSPHSLVQATPIPNLAAITIGPECSNWSSLLARGHLLHRLEPLAANFDYMVLDCGVIAPALVGRTSAGADNVVVAVKQHVSSMRDLSSMIETLRGESKIEPSILMVE